jgi:large subunit ribosomal protein L24
MAAKFHVKKGDEVVVIAGSAKGRRGTINRVLRDKEAVVLEASDERSKDNSRKEQERLAKPVLHYLRKSQQSPQGGLLWLEGPIHISNVMKVADYESRRSTTSSR